MAGQQKATRANTIWSVSSFRIWSNQGYEYLPGLNTPEALLANVRVQLQTLNNVQFADGEWLRFVETWLDKPSDGIVEKTRKIHDDYIHDFVFDDGRIQNIYLLDKKNIARNKVQVIKQFEQTGSHANRYDVTILVNGLPLVQVELKKRGVAIREAFNQVHRYSKESFNSEHSLFKYLQLFVIPTAPTAVTLPTPRSATKTASTSP
jgi:type I restriction enzyme R subunit